ncbi:MAG: hypothetical protein H6Q39_412 [Chloroflexi bacterium]|nr:hypothetical protein [Chloroflexota bacterium]
MTGKMEEMAVKAKIRRWRHVRSGWLVFRPDQMAVYRCKFLSGLEEVKAFDNGSLVGSEPDTASNSLRIVFKSPQEDLTEEELFTFAGESHFKTASAALAGLQKEAEERKRRQEEESARLEKEEQERQRLTREAFAKEVWEISEILWSIARADYYMVYAVMTADWEEARKHYSTLWQQSDRLKIIESIDLAASLNELDTAVSSRNGQEVIRRAGDLIKCLSDQIRQNGTTWSRWENDKNILFGVYPNRRHLPYFLLFAACQYEALLSARIEDWTGVNAALRLLRSSSPIIHRCFETDFDSLLDATSSATAARNTGLIADLAGRLEGAASASFKSRPFRFEASAERAEEENHVVVSQ